MTFAALTAFIGVWATMIVAPGPDVVQIIRTAPRGVRQGVACAAGIVAGIAVWVSASLAGVSALIAARPSMLAVLQVGGGAFLIWMGIASARSGLAARSAARRTVRGRPDRTSDEPADLPSETVAAVGAGDVDGLTAPRAFRLGLATNLSNPKALVFFGAVFAQFITPGMSLGWTFIIAAIMLIMALAWFVGFALLVRAGARFVAKQSANIDILAGVIFGLLGAVMVLEGLRQLPLLS